MALRTQKQGLQEPWKLEELQSGLRNFFEKHQRYPTATEVDAYPYLPSARTIERSFGGLVALRKKLGLGIEHDYRAGSHSSNRAHIINKRAHILEAKVYSFLTSRFGKEFVHREFFFTDDHRTRADFFVYDNKEGFCVDVFYPNSIRSLTGCLNIKLSKYSYSKEIFPYPVIFLQMNETFTQKALDHLAERKERKLQAGQYLMNWDTFAKFCNERGHR